MLSIHDLACVSGSARTGRWLEASTNLGEDFDNATVGLCPLVGDQISVVVVKLTVLLLNVSMTLSPPSLDANTISIIKNGCVLTTLQLIISPPTGVIALSTSAGVVPGAKF